MESNIFTFFGYCAAFLAIGWFFNQLPLIIAVPLSFILVAVLLKITNKS